MRGLAALVVMASHAWRSPWNDPSGGTTTFLTLSAEHVYGGWTTDVLSILGNGAAAVNLFFAISGFVLLQSLTRGPDSNWVNAARFVVARVFRIYPAVLVTIGTFILNLLCDGRFRLLAGRLFLLRHEFLRDDRPSIGALQQGHRGRLLTRAPISRRRMVAIEFGM